MKEESSFIVYEDMNNLYGWAMCQALPMNGFRFVDQLPDDMTGKSYIAEVDVEYPPELHDEHNELPFLVETLQITDNMLSPFQKELKALLGLKSNNVTKLVANLHDKKNYIAHKRLLEQAQNHGLIITKVHKYLIFNEDKWMEPYIIKNTELRKLAKTEFEKSFFKLMNNAVYGKSMENVRKRQDVRLLDTEKACKRIKSPRFKGTIAINDELHTVLLTKEKCTLDKPIYTGQTILDLSKVLMYEYFYEVLEPKFPGVKLMYMDTDSFIFYVECDDYFNTIDLETYDTSNFPADHELYSEVNKKVIGLPKNETGSDVITSVAAIRSKAYSVQSESGKTANRFKGISRYNVAKFKHNEYIECIVESKEGEPVKCARIKNLNHIMEVIEANKKTYNPYDDKRYLYNTIHSRPHGHFKNA